MAYAQIANISPQFNATDYANWWLKAYEQGTTTPLVMALDSSASVTVAKLEINSDGFLKTAGGALTIPYIDGAYDLWLFPTEAEADSNDTVNAIQLADNINAEGGASNIVKSNIGNYTDFGFLTTADMANHLSRDGVTVFDLKVGDIVQTDEFSSGSAGGATYKFTAVGTTVNVDLPNSHNVIVSVVDPTKCFVLRVDQFVRVDQFGATGVGDETAAIQAAIDYAQQFSFENVVLSGGYTATNLSKLNEVVLVSGDKKSTITIGSTVFNVPYREETSGVTSLYVATSGSDSNNCGFDSTVPFATIQGALNYLPTNLAHDTVINIADGTYTDIGGTDEFGRPVNVDVSVKNISALRDSTLPLNDKAAKLIFRGESEAGTIVDGTDSATSRYCFWCHENPGIQFENLTTKNAFWGIMSHQNSDVTLRDVTSLGHDFGRGIESNSRMEVLRGTNGTSAEPNTRNYFLKNGQLQENDSTQGPAVENGIQIDGDGWVYCLRVDIESTASKNLIDSTGKVWMEFDACDIFGGGNNMVVGTYSVMRISNECRIRDFASAVWANESGYTETDGLCHIHNNNFITFTTKGDAVFNLDNCDSLNSSAVDEPNTNGLRLQGAASSALIDPDCTITSADKILSRPTSGLIYKGTSAPSDANTYYERGAIALNEGAAVGQPQGWICTTKGYGGAAVFTAMPNL